jgi:hypothetical protein
MRVYVRIWSRILVIMYAINLARIGESGQPSTIEILQSVWIVHLGTLARWPVGMLVRDASTSAGSCLRCRGYPLACSLIYRYSAAVQLLFTLDHSFSPASKDSGAKNSSIPQLHAESNKVRARLHAPRSCWQAQYFSSRTVIVNPKR